MDLWRLVGRLWLDPKCSIWVAAVAVLADPLLCALIIWKIPYTEIDWTTYMQQVSLYISGERDYTRIEGSTGPLVYPAAHVYIYTLLYYCTDSGRDILLGQIIFAVLYILTLLVVVACYRRAGAPPYLFLLLVLSKRLHSVFLLRLFNDGLATLAMWLAIYLFQRRQWAPAVAVWSFGLGIKMTLLLLAPAIATVLALSLPLRRCAGLASMALLIQILLAIPFLQTNPAGYVSRAFELTRQFMFKWTVNWRFIREDTFLSSGFSIALLVVHGSLLCLFLVRSWLRPSGLSPLGLAKSLLSGKQLGLILSSHFITTTILTSLAVGMLCARSLHYQFFAYLAWATPFLLWRAGLHPVLIYGFWALQEWAWNTYPSTNASSLAVVISLAIQVLGNLLSSMDDAGALDTRAPKATISKS